MCNAKDYLYKCCTSITEITNHPVGGYIPDGSALTLFCRASSSGNPVYSWEKGDSSGHWTTVSDSNSSSYITRTSGEFRCKVSSGNETITSNSTFVNVYGKKINRFVLH